MKDISAKMGVMNVSQGYKTKEKTIDRNGTYIAANEAVLGYNKVEVDVPHILEDKEITENGTYTHSEGYDGLGEVEVNVQPKLGIKGIGASLTENYEFNAQDEGYDGYWLVLVQHPIVRDVLYVSRNGTYTAGVFPYTIEKAFLSVEVDVQPNLQHLTVAKNGTYTPDTGYDGFSEVVINVPQSPLPTVNGYTHTTGEVISAEVV